MNSHRDATDRSLLRPRRRLGGCLPLLLGAWTVGALCTPALAQTPSLEHGVVAAGLLLRQLDGDKRVLMIAAHPDDEDTALLAALARGLGAQTAYLSLTRGDGGQNLIGPELFEGLGAIRTGELLAARALDGAGQFFTRAFDYGFSKSADEAFSMWPRDDVLADVVWVIRSFRPHVIVARFSGTPADGHGQHQAAGILAREAFDAAADPDRFPDHLRLGVEPWQPTLLYGRPGGEGTTVAVETGRFDPLLGRSTFQLAMESRSRHSSQGMGAPQPAGSRVSSLGLERVAEGSVLTGDGFFAGVDTALTSLAAGLPAASRSRALAQLEAYRAAIAGAAGELMVLEPWRAAPFLRDALERLDTVEAIAASVEAGGRGLREAVSLRKRLAGRALLEVAGVVVEVRAADDLLVPGQEVPVEVLLWNGGPLPLEDPRPLLEVPAGWRVSGPEPVTEAAAERFGPSTSAPAAPVDGSGALAPGEMARWRYLVAVPADQEPSRLYWLEAPRDGELYRWPEEPALWGLPGDPPLVRGGAALSPRVPGRGSPVRVETLREAEYVGVDDVSGEFRHPLLVVPALSLSVEPATVVWPLGSAEPRTVTVTITSQLQRDTVTGTLTLDVPSGWTSEPAPALELRLAPGEGASHTFRIRPGAAVAAGRYPIQAVARTSGGAVYREGFRLLDYPHLERVALYQPAEAGVTVVSARLAEGLAVGYVMGTGDVGPEALRQLGVEPELLDSRALLEGDLARFDVLVLGVRAYEARPDLRAANPRVLDFARRGGTVLVQYNQYGWSEGDFAPYPLEIRRPHDRVTDEGAPVRMLEPEAPPLASPNRITAGDFEGWVTERGLYFPGRWDPRYVPLLEMADPGEEPQRGALLVAPVEEGLYVYTGLSFFRQLAAGVPGAYRLFANLVSLTAEDWRRRVPVSER